MAFIPSTPPSTGAYRRRLSSHKVVGVSSSHYHRRTIMQRPPLRRHHHHHLEMSSIPFQGIAVAKYGGLRHSFQLVLAFLLGGIFFSTTLSVINAFATLGRENIRRGWDLTKIVLGRVWTVYTYGIGVAWETLYKGKRFRPRAFWRVLKEQLTLTRTAAVEGIEAIKLEASLYTAAVGPTNMVLAQYALDNLTPKLLANLAKLNIEKALSEIENNNIRNIELERFQFGSRGPKLLSGRTYDLRKDNAMAADFDVQWDSDSQVDMNVTPKLLGVNRSKSRIRVPLTITNFKFEGVVRVILTPLTDTPPGFGAMLVSFPKSPVIGLDCTVSKLEITKAPWLKTELLKEIQKSVSQQFLWPRRILLPSVIVPEPIKPVLSRKELEQLQNSDPLLKAEQIIDSNEVWAKNKLIRLRDVADEEEMLENMDIFVGDANERKNATATSNTARNNNRGVVMRFPWQKMDNTTAKNVPFRFPWQNNNSTIIATEDGNHNNFRFPWQRPSSNGGSNIVNNDAASATFQFPWQKNNKKQQNTQLVKSSKKEENGNQDDTNER